MTTDSIQPPPPEAVLPEAGAAGATALPPCPQQAPMTLTVRLIRSFEYRTFKNLVLRNVAPETRVGDLKATVLQTIRTTPGFKPFLATQFDTLKTYMQPHGHKTQNLIVNLDHDDDWLLDDSVRLCDAHIENETELSMFNRAAYDAYKAHPETKW